MIYAIVDKTGRLLPLVDLSIGKLFFIARPRRFGKSLCVSTPEALFGGRCDLFQDLSVKSRWDWSKKCPVLHPRLWECPFGRSRVQARPFGESRDSPDSREGVCGEVRHVRQARHAGRACVLEKTPYDRLLRHRTALAREKAGPRLDLIVQSICGLISCLHGTDTTGRRVRDQGAGFRRRAVSRY